MFDMKDIRKIVTNALVFFLLIFVSQKPLFGQPASKILFEDSMMGDWQKNWFLDGKKAIVGFAEKLSLHL